MDAALTKARSKAKRSNVRKTAPLQSTHGSVKQKKDPGIPNLTLLKAALSRRADREQAKEDRRNRHTRNVATAPAASSSAVAASSSSSPAAEQRDDSGGFFTTEEARDTAVAASRHHFYRDLRQVIADSDIVLEVLDARDPLGCRNLQVEAAVVSALQSDQAQAKRLVLVLNKIDLVSAANLQLWLRYLKRSHPVVAFKASTQQQAAQLNRHEPSVQSLAAAASSSSPSSSVADLARSGCVGASALIQLLKNYSRNLHLKRSITVGVIGAPNVGKSSLINSLKRCRAVAVGNKPGVTRHAQHVRLDKLLTLIDSPGVIAAAPAGGQQAADDADERLLLRNCISVDKLSDPVAAAEVLLRHVPLASLLSTYSLPASATASSFLVHLARKQGKLLPGGLPNLDAAARCLLQDLNSGKISYETQPPEEADEVAAGAASAVQVVQGWAEEFDVEALLAGRGELKVERAEDQEAGSDREGESIDAQEATMANDAGLEMQQG